MIPVTKRLVPALLIIPLALIGIAIAKDVSKPSRQPNIVLIFCDDHASPAISAYGDPRKLIETPNIDHLAKEGMLFKRCLVTSSICGPSRAAVLTGKYAHLNGFYNNETTPFDGSQQTFPKLLQKAGYQTAIIGKWHLVSDPTGFDHWEILPNQGQYYNPPMICDGKKVVHEGYVTDIITDLSMEWIRNRDKSKPFMLMCQPKAPHMPWEPALRNLDFDKDRHYPVPETFFDDYGNGRGKAWKDNSMRMADILNDDHLKLIPPVDLNPEQRKIWDAYYEPRNAAFRAANLSGRELAKWKYQRLIHDYLGCVASVDENVGRIMKFLKEQGLAENTIVVYSSDQGVFLGEHGWFDKRWILEPSLTTPLIFRWPGVTKPGSLCDKIVSLLDLPETFLAAAGVAKPADMQGESLIPLLKGENAPDWRTSFYYHYYEYPRWHRVRPQYGVVTDRYKLVHFYKPDIDEWELYDLKENPQETINFINHPAHAKVVEELHAELERLRKELKVPAESEEPRAAYGHVPFDDPAAMPLRGAHGEDVPNLKAQQSK